VKIGRGRAAVIGYNALKQVILRTGGEEDWAKVRCRKSEDVPVRLVDLLRAKGPAPTILDVFPARCHRIAPSGLLTRQVILNTKMPMASSLKVPA